MDSTELSMRNNIHKNTGQTFEQWIAIIKDKNFAKHGDIMKFLKEEHGFTHGFANFVALKARATDAASAENTDDLITKKYKGKEQLKPIYDQLMVEILKFGTDVETAPKNAYVSLKRRKQFAILQPATKTRFEVGLNLKGQEPAGLLEAITAAKSMCSHKINLGMGADITPEVIDWLKKAYEKAG
jgi:predicted transport protein